MKFVELYSIIKQRKKERPVNSYVASLYKKGEDTILQKIGEEAIEVLLAAKGESKLRLIEEIADLYFMTLILLVAQNIPLEKVFDELEKRRK